MKKTRAQVYRDAARLIETGEQSYSCIAVAMAQDPLYDDGATRRCRDYAAVQDYVALYMGAYEPTDFQVAIERDGDQWNLRVLLLCFAAALAETGDLMPFAEETAP